MTFQISALYDALDARRRDRGLTWTQVTREINDLFRDVPARPISTSTLTGMGTKRAMDGNGVLQMLVWLERSPESFLSDRRGATLDNERLPRVGPSRILRFDTATLYAALDDKRREQGMSWRQVAETIGGIRAAGLTRLAKGGHIDLGDALRMAGWLSRPLVAFTRAAPR